MSILKFLKVLSRSTLNDNDSGPRHNRRVAHYVLMSGTLAFTLREIFDIARYESIIGDFVQI